MTQKLSKPVLMGVIGAPHGVKGQVRVKSYTGDPLALGDYGPLSDKDGRIYEVVDIRPAKTVVVVTFKGIRGREVAEKLNGTELFVDRSRLPDDALEDDEFFIDDLIGLSVVDADGAPAGRVVAVHNFGADDMVEVKPAGGGRSELYPFTREVVPQVDFEVGHLVLIPPSEIIAREGDEE